MKNTKLGLNEMLNNFQRLLFEDGIGKVYSKRRLFLTFSNGGWLIFQN